MVTVKDDPSIGVELSTTGEDRGEVVTALTGEAAPEEPEVQGAFVAIVTTGLTGVTVVALATAPAVMRGETAEAGLVFAARDLVVLERVVLRKLSSSSLVVQVKLPESNVLVVVSVDLLLLVCWVSGWSICRLLTGGVV